MYLKCQKTKKVKKFRGRGAEIHGREMKLPGQDQKRGELS
jgi:hypothetical protein